MSLDLDEKLQLEDEMEESLEAMWTQYVRRGNPMTTNVESVSRRLEELSPKLFCQPEKMQFDFLDVSSKIPLRGMPMLADIRAFLKDHPSQETSEFNLGRSLPLTSLMICFLGMKSQRLGSCKIVSFNMMYECPAHKSSDLSVPQILSNLSKLHPLRCRGLLAITMLALNF